MSITQKEWGCALLDDNLFNFVANYPKEDVLDDVRIKTIHALEWFAQSSPLKLKINLGFLCFKLCCFTLQELADVLDEYDGRIKHVIDCITPSGCTHDQALALAVEEWLAGDDVVVPTLWPISNKTTNC